MIFYLLLLIAFHLISINVLCVVIITAIGIDVRNVTICKSTDIPVNRGVEVEDIDITMTVSAVIIDWLAMLIQTVVIERQVICKGNALTSSDWIFE